MTSKQFPTDLVTFTEEILNGKLIFCAVYRALTVFEFSNIIKTLTVYLQIFSNHFH